MILCIKLKKCNHLVFRSWHITKRQAFKISCFEIGCRKLRFYPCLRFLIAPFFSIHKKGSTEHTIFLRQDVAKRVGEAIAKACLEKGIEKVAFDRGGYPYHGRIEALADAAREHGLQF